MSQVPRASGGLRCLPRSGRKPAAPVPRVGQEQRGLGAGSACKGGNPHIRRPRDGRRRPRSSASASEPGRTDGSRRLWYAQRRRKSRRSGRPAPPPLARDRRPPSPLSSMEILACPRPNDRARRRSKLSGSCVQGQDFEWNVSAPYVEAIHPGFGSRFDHGLDRISGERHGLLDHRIHPP